MPCISLDRYTMEHVTGHAFMPGKKITRVKWVNTYKGTRKRSNI